MNGSIRFNDDINIEVDVDPSAAEGARLTSAVNLVDGQELGIGGGDAISIVPLTDDGVRYTSTKTWNEIKELLADGIVVLVNDKWNDLNFKRFFYVSSISIEDDNYILYCFPIGGSLADFHADNPDDYPTFIYD